MTREEIAEELRKIAEPALAKKPEERNYEERYNVWEYEKFVNRDLKYDEGEEVEIFDGEKLVNNEIKDGFGRDFPEWFRNIGRFFGKKVKMDNNKTYTLIGVSYTYLDYYYILKDVNNRKSMWSCVGGFQLAQYNCNGKIKKSFLTYCSMV